MPEEIRIQRNDDQSPRAVWISALGIHNCKFAHKISSRQTGSYAVHKHDFYEVLYVVSGEASYYIAGNSYPLHGGMMVTIPPDVMHGIMVTSETPYERYTVHFLEDCLSMERRRMLLQTLPRELLGMVSQDQGKAAIWENMEHSGVLQTLEAMETLRECDQSLREKLVPIFLEAMLAPLLIQGGVHTRQESTELAARAHANSTKEELVSYIDQHYTESMTLKSLAERFFLSPGYVSMLFKQATGCTVKDYVRRRRIAHVQMLLAAGVPISQAANRSGFSDYTTFYRTYLKETGHAPSESMKTGAAENPLLNEAILKQAQQMQDHSDGLKRDIFYPEDGTQTEDPSMLDAVRLSNE